jgi:hypothetical protein
MIVLVFNVLHQLRMMLFVPPELTLMLQASANGNDDSGQEVSVSLHAEHEVKGHLQTNGGDCQRFQIVKVLRNRAEVLTSLTLA